MRKLFLTLISIITLSSHCSAFSYRVEGQVSDPAFEGCQISLYDNFGGGSVASDTIRDGRFMIQGQSDISFAGSLLGYSKETKKISCALIVEDGTSTVDIDNARQISGGPLFGKSQEFTEKLSNATPDEVPGLLREVIVSNPDNAFGEMALANYTEFCSPDEWSEVYALVAPHVRERERFKISDQDFNRMRSTWIGQPFVDITGKTPGGEDVRLSDYVGKGKYVLVDFWASWCGGCIKMATNTLKPLYENLKADGRFEIIGVAVSDRPQSSIKAIEQHAYPWPQIIDCGDTPMTDYGFRVLPMLILFGPDGKVVARSGNPLNTITQINRILNK